jgi:hypothetical protein
MADISGDYAVILNTEFRYSEMFDKNTLINEVNKIDPFTTAVTLRRTKK